MNVPYWLRNLPYRVRGGRQELLALARIGLTAELRAVHIKADGTRIDLGVLSRRLVTNAGAAFIVDAFQNTTEIENFNFHGSGTGTNAENVTDTALQTEVETRATGTQSEPSSQIYRTVGTVSYTATRAITEHGVFSASSAGTLLDRSQFSAINVNNGDSIQFTYEITINSGG